MAEFNLIDKPWIPCIDLQGNSIEHGIRDTLLKAHELREICDDSPLVTVTIHRLLLAILHRALTGPTDMNAWKRLWERASLAGNKPLTSYLGRWHDRFWLFHDTSPFMQVAELDLNRHATDGTVKEDKTDGLMRLAREAPDKGGRVLFDHRMGTERPEYEHGETARMVLAAQSYAGTGVASSGKVGTEDISPTPCQFAPCVDGLVLWFQGDNLFQTLLFNLVPHNVRSSDLPAWEDDRVVRSAEQSWRRSVRFSGPVQRFAPLSRFIRCLDRRTVFFTNAEGQSSLARCPHALLDVLGHGEAAGMRQPPGQTYQQRCVVRFRMSASKRSGHCQRH
jgi:CRISPR system Cascade subunit CasA